MARNLPVDLYAAWSSIPLTHSDALALENAAYHDFREPVTAYLTSVYFVGGLCLGIVWGHDKADATGRFADGHRIHTSQIVSIERDGDFPVIVTLNSRYVLISLHAEYPHGSTVH
jgi:hypothetical protein